MTLPPAPRPARWLLAAYTVAVIAVVFQPRPSAAVGSVDLGYAVIVWLGLDAVVTPTMVEFAWNTVMFVPLTLLGAWGFPTLDWKRWVAVALLATAIIEGVQLLFLSGRSASLLDLASNTLGGVLGALLALRSTWPRDGRHPNNSRKDCPATTPAR